MKKPYARKLKKKVGKILHGSSRITAFEQLEKIPSEQLTGPLFSHFFHQDELIKFRSIAAMGDLCARMAIDKMEKSRIILRRIMWNLNDESGGIGWGSPGAMGEILAKSPELALEFKSILFSYLDPGGNFIEHKMLQRDVLWGVGTFVEASPKDLSFKTQGLLYGFLHSNDPVKRGYAIRALTAAGSFDCSLVPENIMTDHSIVNIFHDWHFIHPRISEMVLACKNTKSIA